MRTVAAAAIGLAISLASIGNASAQGVGSGPWNGFYMGAHAGYGFRLPDTKILESEAEDAYPRTADPSLGRDAIFSGKVDTDVNGFTGGLHAGYNFQLSSVVIGFEGDWDFGELDGSGKARLIPKRNDATGDPPKYLSLSNRIEDLASFRGRLGYVTGSALIYGTGGVAWADWQGSTRSPDGVGDDSESGTFNYGNDLLVGWVAGAGVEYKVTNYFSLRAEYLHYDFGAEKFANDDDINNLETVVGSQEVRVDQVRIGATFHAN